MLPKSIFAELCDERKELLSRLNVPNQSFRIVCANLPKMTTKVAVGIIADDKSNRSIDMGSMPNVYMNPSVYELNDAIEYIVGLLDGLHFKISKRYAYLQAKHIGVYYISPKWDYWYSLKDGEDCATESIESMELD